jgi:hypothetical protein
MFKILTYLHTIEETKAHIFKVSEFLGKFIKEIEKRSLNHDESKLSDEELPYFAKSKNLRKMTYGSKEYFEQLELLKPALDHHYKNNKHHPEHFENGIDDMDLIDLVEMFCDWKAATLRHKDGDINKSIEINSQRFKMSDQLKKIFINTLKVI